MMVADIAPEMQLTIMETINSMSHELLIEFYNENVCPSSTPEVAPPETFSTTSALKRPSDKVCKSKPMTAMALILQTVTLLSGLKPVDASGGDIFEVENVVSLRHSDGAYEIKWKGYPTSGNTFEPKCNLHCIGTVQSFHWLNDLPAVNFAEFGTPPPSPIDSTTVTLRLVPNHPPCLSRLPLTFLLQQLLWDAAHPSWANLDPPRS